MNDPIVDEVRQAVGQDAVTNQKLRETAAKADREDTPAAGLADVKGGRTKPARAVLCRLAGKYGITAGSKGS